MFDIAKAFDKAWHNGLVFKLVKIGIPFYIVNWIIKFLDNRLFCVKINEKKSINYKAQGIYK